jgi:Terminase RNaseH-like domain
VGEFVDLLDTPAMIAAIKARYPMQTQARLITIYPDASGKNRKSGDASVTDIALLRQAGFSVLVDPSNPSVRDRILSVNTLCLNAFGIRRLFVNAQACPALTNCLELQAYGENGEPDKKQGFDHSPDGLGYSVVKLFPVAVRGAWRESQVA